MDPCVFRLVVVTWAKKPTLLIRYLSNFLPFVWTYGVEDKLLSWYMCNLYHFCLMPSSAHAKEPIERSSSYRISRLLSVHWSFSWGPQEPRSRYFPSHSPSHSHSNPCVPRPAACPRQRYRDSPNEKAEPWKSSFIFVIASLASHGAHGSSS